MILAGANQREVGPQGGGSLYPVYSAHCFSLSVGTTKTKTKTTKQQQKRDFIESLLHLNYVAIELIQLNTQSNGLEKKLNQIRSKNQIC